MNIIVKYTTISLVSTYLLWIFYLAVMCLKRAYDEKKLTKLTYYLGLPILWVGLALDIFVNVFVMTIILLELPREFLVTSRLKRHESDASWKGQVVEFVRPFVDPFDPSGEHI